MTETQELIARLRNCRFCGSEIIAVGPLVQPSMVNGHRACCGSCGASGPECPSESEAVAAWNGAIDVADSAVTFVLCARSDGDQYAIFSTLENAEAWCDAQPEPCVIVNPMMIDHPEFGNVQSN